MTTNGNFKRKHFLAPYTNGETEPTTWYPFGNRIAAITDESADETDSTVFYDSEDGNPEETLLSRQESWTFEGQYDPTDEAHQLVAKARRADDNGRKVWHKIEETDGSTVVGAAKIFDPVAGGGEAGAKEILSGRIAFIKKAQVKPAE